MIIQALNDCYGQLKNNPKEDIPLLGFSREKVQFALVLDANGKLIHVNDLRENKKGSKLLIVPEAVKRASNIKPNFMCDNTGYVLGRDKKDDKERSKKTFEEFKKFHHSLGNGIDDTGMKTVLKFLDSWQPEKLEQSKCREYWEEMTGMKIVFQLDGERGYVHEHLVVRERWLKYRTENKSEYEAICLVSGQRSSISRIHNSIQGVMGAQTKGADIVSFNQDSFRSYGKEQSFNAPVSETAMFNYTTALKHLLRFESRQKLQIGDTTTVFWAEVETPITGFLKDILDPKDNQAELADLRSFLEAVREGKMPDFGDAKNMKFFILGLSPNASRLSIRFWYVGTVDDICRKIGQHFSDLKIKRTYDDEPEYPGLWRLLIETLPKRIGHKRKSEDVSPLLAGTFARAIMTGGIYPTALLSQIIERIRRDGDLSYFRLALIKAYLVRNSRIMKKKVKEVGMSLDREQRDIGYLLGRLFAVLEKAQKDAVPEANTTIKDRFYGSASSTPAVVFPQLIRLAQHHIQKSQYGRLIEKTIEEVFTHVQVFPVHLSLEEQGMFALGYYHQKPEMYKKIEKKEEE